MEISPDQRNSNGPAMRIRKYRDADASGLVELYERSVRGLGPRDYTAAQVEAWASLTPSVEMMRQRYGDGRTAMVATDEQNRLIGFGDIEQDGHIGYFYCAPEVVGLGVAAALYRVLEATAREAGTARIFVEASAAARRFFLRHGLEVLEKREFLLGNVPIHNFAMEKRLTSSYEDVVEDKSSLEKD
ncbi:GNAT family N-acetyltransferase [Microvirga rosea]|uniref:GNAT family N-acetyltransferase n=1 Tax=Microvirga rosea TaxID=2715425 RepID=UPI001D0ABC52|nr:GNAT family N-acetyltransferase [Microvirga rosea]MCB8822245.1 GNAT family N-acetyltransferase [Microvirga rosea]